MLERAVYGLLCTAMGMGCTAIVTNATSGWLRSTAEKYMPSVVPLMKRIHVTSAQDHYKPIHGDKEPDLWKKHAFQDVVAHFSKHSWVMDNSEEHQLQVLAIDDNSDNIEAAHLCLTGCEAVVKTLEFKEGPTIEELLCQLQLLQQDLPKLLEQRGGCYMVMEHGLWPNGHNEWRLSKDITKPKAIAPTFPTMRSSWYGS